MTALRNELEPVSRGRIWLWRSFVLLGVAIFAWSVRDREWDVVWKGAGFLSRGLATSVEFAVLALMFGAALAVPLVIARTYGPAGIRHIAIAIIEIIRGTPELMVVIWVFFFFPAVFGKGISNWIAGLISLTLIACVYLAEVIRGGLRSVPSGQWEAGHSTGLTPAQTFFHIVLPQALRNMLPAFVAQVVMLFKTTSLVYAVGVIEFFRSVVTLNNIDAAPVALYTTMAVVYFICCSALSWAVRKLDPAYQIYE